jgi:hypothetical protein
MAQKLQFFFANISGEILLHILGYHFCAKNHIYLHFLPNAVAIKASNTICAKAALRWCMKCKHN